MKRSTGKKLLGTLLVLCLLLTWLPVTALAASESITFARPAFTDSDDALTLSGEASLDSANGRLRLVPNAYNMVGGMFTTDKVAMGASGFSMAVSVYCGISHFTADGFAIVLSKDSNVCRVEAAGGHLGYVGMGNSVAVQYATFSTYGSNDIRLGINGEQNPAGYSRYSSGFDVPNGGYVYFWLDYDAAADKLAVRASNSSTRPISAAASYDIDLGDYERRRH